MGSLLTRYSRPSPREAIPSPSPGAYHKVRLCLLPRTVSPPLSDMQVYLMVLTAR